MLKFRPVFAVPLTTTCAHACGNEAIAHKHIAIPAIMAWLTFESDMEEGSGFVTKNAIQLGRRSVGD